MATAQVFDFDYELSGIEATSYVPLDSYVESVSGEDHLVTGANDYFALHPKKDIWDSLSDAEKQQLLVRATARLDLEQFGGRKSQTNQRLQFPRLWIISRNYEEDYHIRFEFTGGDYFQSEKYLPPEMEMATFEMAMYLYEEITDETPLFSRQDQERMSKVTIGPLSADLRRAKEERLPDVVVRALKAMGANGWLGARQLRLMR